MSAFLQEFGGECHQKCISWYVPYFPIKTSFVITRDEADRFLAHIAAGGLNLVIYAEGHGIDHIVVGHRGHSLFERQLIGSVARRVIAYAPCAVTVVRPRA
ncbi:hypothetical protein THSYN_29440 (plasmid) [Candidatus Thiodictyon syntrophicum]|uniref:UspA domain-containing protein n=1 Tax=Candidatus Thiodictyon syntrophicum TaxID=1166950 RepID=A0A2K8UHU3_9GAMM|nr:hypothetical protein THSYN_29440 [Candidatus Thiodictyon syntrophicum]